MTTQPLFDRRRPAGPDPERRPARDERSMRMVELVMAFTAIAVVVLLALWRA